MTTPDNRDRSSLPSLREAIESFQEARSEALDHHAVALLKCLAASPEAGKAFAQLDLAKAGQRSALLTTCIQAEQLYRRFEELTNVPARLEPITRRKQVTAELLAFVEQIANEQVSPSLTDHISAMIREPADNINRMRQGLLLLAEHLGAQERIVREDALRLGANRSRHIEHAGENAAIAWLAAGIRQLTGERNLTAATDLAQVILSTELTEDRVKKAIKARDREWRLPLGDDSVES